MVSYETVVQAIVAFSSTVIALKTGYTIVLTFKKPQSSGEEKEPATEIAVGETTTTENPVENSARVESDGDDSHCTTTVGAEAPLEAVAIRDAVGRLPLAVRIMRRFLENGDGVGLVAFGPELLTTEGLTADEHARVANMYGIGLRRSGRMAEGEDCFKAALATATTDKTRVEALSNLCNLYNGQARFDEADACIDQALVIDPQSMPAQVNSLCTASLRGDADACRVRARRLRERFADARTGTSDLAQLIRIEPQLRYLRSLKSFASELPEVAATKPPRRDRRRAGTASLAVLVLVAAIAPLVISAERAFATPTQTIVAKGKGIDAGGRRPVRPLDMDDLGVPFIERRGIDAGG